MRFLKEIAVVSILLNVVAVGYFFSLQYPTVENPIPEDQTLDATPSLPSEQHEFNGPARKLLAVAEEQSRRSLGAVAVPHGGMQHWITKLQAYKDSSTQLPIGSIKSTYNPHVREDLEIWDYFNETIVLDMNGEDGFRPTLLRGGRTIHPIPNLSSHVKSKIKTAGNLLDGFRRVSPSHGVEYIFRYRSATSSSGIVSVHVAVPLLANHPVMSLLPPAPCNHEKRLHVVVPLSGRSSTFQRFLQSFEDAVYHGAAYFQGHCVTITVYYMNSAAHSDEENGQHYDAIVNALHASRVPNGTYHTEYSTEPFGRAQVSHNGVISAIERFSANDTADTVFIVDVDMWISASFLQRCHQMSIHDHSAYFPIVFLQHNPKVTNPRNPSAERYRRNLDVYRDSGIFCVAGSGMFCSSVGNYLQYNTLKSWATRDWGGEDSDNFKSFIKSPLEVIRAIEPGLVHRWHEQDCCSISDPLRKKYCVRSITRVAGSRESLSRVLLTNGGVTSCKS